LQQSHVNPRGNPGLALPMVGIFCGGIEAELAPISKLAAIAAIVALPFQAKPIETVTATSPISCGTPPGLSRFCAPDPRKMDQ
jgi:hypothetical protein